MLVEIDERRRIMAALLRRKREEKGRRRPMPKERLAKYARKVRPIDPWA